MKYRSALGILACLLALGASADVFAADADIRISEVLAIVEGPSLVDPFRRPRNLFIDPDQELVFVADAANNRIVIFDKEWRSRGLISYLSGVDRPQPGEPSAIAMDEDGRLFVVDAITAEVEVLSPRGSRIASLRPNEEVPELADARPQDIAIGPSGRIYVLYGGQGTGIVVLDDKGALVGTLGLDAAGENAMTGPMAMALGPDEEWIAVADPMGKRQVHLFPTDGGASRSFGKPGRQDGELSIAIDVAWGPEASLWVTDTARNTIEVYDESGEYRGRIGGFGYGPGQFNYPAGCAFLAPDRLVVLERAGARVQVLALTLPDLRQREDRVELVPPVPETEPGSHEREVQWR
jgi:DNA-binding beta-propeller fold protein YncE